MRLGLALLLIPTLALAQPQGAMVKLSSGTGFVVNNEGNIITNAHVVKGCRAISLLTPNGPASAQLVASDPQRDLAVLKASFTSPYNAPLRWNISELKIGDPVVVMGYPGKLGATGRYEYKKTEVSALSGPSGEKNWLQLKSVAAQGNSGGPVLDDNGNVIAVVTGIATTYRADANGNPVGSPLGQADIAITLAALEEFLREHSIDFARAESNDLFYGDNVLRDNARNFTVPVRCIQ